MIFVQEFLRSGDPAEIEATFTALRDGMQACQGDIPAGEEGPGSTESMAIPAVGEDRGHGQGQSRRCGPHRRGP